MLEVDLGSAEPCDDSLKALMHKLLHEVTTEHTRALERHNRLMHLLASRPDVSDSPPPIARQRFNDSKDLARNADRRGSSLSVKSFADIPRTFSPPSPVKKPSKKISYASGATNHFIQARLQASSEGYGYRNCLHAFVSHNYFELLVATMIVVNALVMCVEVELHGQSIGSALGYPKYTLTDIEAQRALEKSFLACNTVFGFVFAIEMCLKLLAYGMQYFRVFWHCVDVVCNIVFLMDMVASVLVPVNASSLRLIRLCRLLRLAKFIGVLERMEILHTLTTALRGMGQILFWAMVLLSVMLMTCALLLTQLLHTSYFGDPNAHVMSSDEVDKARKLFQYFGTFERCLLSMFELTLANWPPVARLLFEDVSQWFFPASIVHKLVIGFAVIGVINAIILQETMKVAATDDTIMFRQKKRQSTRMRKKLQIMFNALDKDGDGALSLPEFLAITDQPEILYWLQAMNIRTDSLTKLFRYVDKDNSGTISVDEFVTRIPQASELPRMCDMLELQRIIDEDSCQRNSRVKPWND
eukprot:TRINITY_DN55685_c0_g2_i1.p1 TRINITY_DN55685_c0_g2~~TRINITY_DN55685_c0_g2_i1.p1  ORF type:complete len:528 (-),score=45.95 TRINITY_DN55685_c0_g2_i1:10-1593(-)